MGNKRKVRMRISKQLRILKFNYDSLFQIGYFLLIFNQVLAQSQFNEMKYPSLLLQLFRWLLISFFTVLIMCKGKYPYNRTGLFWICFAVIAITEMLFFNGKILLIILFLLVIASYKTNMNSLIKIHIKALISGIIVVSFSSWIGVLDILGVYKQFDNISGFLFKQSNIRYAFGFINSNIIPINSLYLYLYTVLTKKDNYKWYLDVFVVIVNYLIYLLCGSRVSILLLLFAVFLRILIQMDKKRFLSLFAPMAVVLLIGCLMFSLILPSSTIYTTSLVAIIDKLLTARITIMRNVFARFPITLFGYGEVTIDNSVEYLVMDNGYIALFVMRGLIIGLIFMTFLLMMINTSKKSKDPYLLMFIIIMILANIVDNSILHYITFPIYIMSFNNMKIRKDRGISLHE
ncbi:MAG: hypothetical protein V8T93_02410 [Streptococcus thermophilus]|uniref:hypothetical protein n=1 Tax=Streptococcus thermophilus TaxID=1308 RepID=UPI001159A2FB|nr:hypothetical protein [Streptococcus thermophilus]MBW7804675.1 hypothetical protein [Streptococcus thermophilus]